MAISPYPLQQHLAQNLESLAVPLSHSSGLVFHFVQVNSHIILQILKFITSVNISSPPTPS